MTGARWIADERIGRHDLGERDQPRTDGAARNGGDLSESAPRMYPFIERLDRASFDVWCLIVADAGLVQ